MFGESYDDSMEYELVEEAEELLAMNVEMGDQVAANLKLSTITVVVLIVILTLAAAALGMAFARYTAVDIAKPIEKIQKATHKLAEGKLDISVFKFVIFALPI